HRTDVASLSAEAKLSRGGVERDVSSRLAVRYLDQEFVWKTDVGEAAFAFDQPRDIQCNELQAQIVDGVHLYQQLFAFGDLRVVFRLPDHHRRRLVLNGLDGQRFDGAVFVQIAEGGAVGIDGGDFQIDKGF